MSQSSEKEALFKELCDAVVDMDEEKTIVIAKSILERKIDAYEAITQGLTAGMERAGQLFDEEEYFIPELLMCSDAMYAGLEVLKPHLSITTTTEQKAKIVIGVIEGDTHDIGKNLVKIMLETAGYDMVDLGRDVPPAVLVERALAEQAEIIAISTLMTTTMDGMAEVITLLQEQNIRNNFKVIVGGGPVSQSFADKIGANGYAVNAADAVRLVNRLTGGQQ